MLGYWYRYCWADAGIDTSIDTRGGSKLRDSEDLGLCALVLIWEEVGTVDIREDADSREDVCGGGASLHVLWGIC